MTLVGNDYFSKRLDVVLQEQEKAFQRASFFLKKSRGFLNEEDKVVVGNILSFIQEKNELNEKIKKVATLVFLFLEKGQEVMNSPEFKGKITLLFGKSFISDKYKDIAEDSDLYSIYAKNVSSKVFATLTHEEKLFWVSFKESFKVYQCVKKLECSYGIELNNQTIRKGLIQDGSCEIFERKMLGFPLNEFYRLYIDFDKQEFKNPFVFDVEEPGYRKAMEGAFEYLHCSVNKRLDLEELIILHDYCVDGVFNRKDDSYFKKGIVGGREYYEIKLDYVEEDALKELGEFVFIQPWTMAKLQEKYLFFKQDIGLVAKENENRCINLYGFDEHFISKTRFSVDFRETKGQEIIDVYHQEIEKAASDDEKLRATAKCCRYLEMFHLFNDGNQRTISFILLNKLLLQNGFSFCILKNPFIFDGYYCLNTLVEYIKEGMKIFAGLKKP